VAGVEGGFVCEKIVSELILTSIDLSQEKQKILYAFDDLHSKSVIRATV
jgi:hypothetical protein